MMQIDLKSDWRAGCGLRAIGDDAEMLSSVSSEIIACGGDAGDPDTLCRMRLLAREVGVTARARPWLTTPLGLHGRVIRKASAEIDRTCAARNEALTGIEAQVAMPLACSA